MPKRKANAEWKGTLQDGNGTVALESGAFQGLYSFSTRFENEAGTNPEELIAAAHAGCFSMALSAELGKSGYNPESVKTDATVHLVKDDSGFSISEIDLDCDAHIPGIDEDTFLTFAEGAKKNCPVSKVLAGAKINLTARLKN
ncbi:OsmC family protein [Balneolaceae bacterium ANBcel3]|nr:OsmC family protein [Balneolaceae bacterium ANBcel3]